MSAILAVDNPAEEKTKLRALIAELTERMVKALDCPEGNSPEKGKETATFADIKAALSTVCDVYRLLNGTGDLDPPGGSALGELERKFHGIANSRR